MCAEQGSRDSSVWRAVSLCCRWSASSLPQQTAGSRAGSCLTSLAHLEGSWEEGMGTQKAPLILCKRAQGRRAGSAAGRVCISGQLRRGFQGYLPLFSPRGARGTFRKRLQSAPAVLQAQASGISGNCTADPHPCSVKDFIETVVGKVQDLAFNPRAEGF